MHHNLQNSPNWGRWSRELELLVDWLLDNETMSDGDALRRLAELIRTAPHPDLAEGVIAPEPTVVEHLLAAGAAETLALRFISADSGFFVSRGAAGEYLVSVVLADRGGETTAAGTSLARAVVCALAMTLARPQQSTTAPLIAQATAGATLH